ncbi:MAG TPA: hypothetical protein VKY59_13915 [Spirillospora sp.]|nr:hypothetical protein [Spirillospora sp.]
MHKTLKLHSNESGQVALESAIILIAFIVVASVFAFTILSAGSSSTERGEEAIYAGLEGVQSSMSVKGAVIAESSGTSVDTVTFTLALVTGGDPIDLTDTSGDNVVVIGYRDGAQFVNEVPWTIGWVGANDADTMLEAGELAEIAVDLSGLGTALGRNTPFTLEIKPPTGAVLNISRTTPASIEPVMELR